MVRASQKRQEQAGLSEPPAVARTERLKKKRSGTRRGERLHRASRDGQARDLIGLACFGLGVFLIIVLAAGASGGLLGGAAARGLALALGRFAFLVPVSLLAVAVVLLFRLRPAVPAAMFWGGAVVLSSLVLLVAGGFPPFGPGHGVFEFVADTYRARAGILGEAFYVGVRRLTGDLGVALLGWLGLVAGVTLITGWTMTKLTERARLGAERVAALARSRGRQSESGPLDDPYLSGFGPSEKEAFKEDVSSEDTTWALGDWGALDPAPRRPVLRIIHGGSRGARLHDGAAEFPDVFGGGAGDPEDEVATLAPTVAQNEASPTAEAEEASGTDGIGAAVPDTESGVRQWVLPDADFLLKSSRNGSGEMRADESVGQLLVDTLAQFGVEARVSGTVVGPQVTRYELQLAPGTKVSKVASLKDDLAYALATTDIRILAPIPGKSAVGVEVPNQRTEYVTLGDIFRQFPPGAGPLMVWLGKDITGRAVYTDLTKMPHLLIAGTTGSGKSGCINCIISSVLLRATPEQVRMVLIDPKKVELSHYERVPHLLVPVVTNMKSAASVLANLVREMEERYSILELARARNLDETNRVRQARGEPTLPYLLVVIDELADLMMVSPTEVEECVIRLAQKARAVGIHLVVATQRPSSDVITGMIKANMPSRIAFAVSSQIDSRVILDVNGAEALLGRGDMLFKPLGSSKLQRIQGAFITPEEIEFLVTHWRRQAEPDFREELLISPEQAMAEEAVFDPDSDDLLAEAAELVLDTGNASVSMLQRRLRVGYTRAGRLIDMLERRGIVGPYEGSKPRQVLVGAAERAQVLEALRAEIAHGKGRQLSLEEGVDDQ